MTTDDVFRLAWLAICLAFMPCGLYFRLRAHTGEKIDRRQEGLLILLGLRLSAFLLAAAVLLWLIRPSWMQWSAAPIPVWLRWTGVVVAALGAGLWVWAVSNLGKNLTDTVVTRREHSLVTSGPYRWVRHPFYTACVIGLIGLSLLMANWFVPLAGGVLWFAFLLPRTKIEERNLVARFGDDYREFMRRTGRFLPRIRK